MSNEDIFVLYTAAASSRSNSDRDKVVMAFEPWLVRWAGDVLRPTTQSENSDWKAELIAVGYELVLETIPSLYPKPVESGRHLVNWMRLEVRKKMRKAWRNLSNVRSTADLSIHEAVEWDVPIYLTHKRKQLTRVYLDPFVALRNLEFHQSNSENATSNWVDGIIDPDGDGRKRRYQEFVLRSLNAACFEADRLGWSFVRLMREAELSTSKVAGMLNVSRSTLRDRLTVIGYLVAASASPELNELGHEFLGEDWILAAKNGRKRHRNIRGPRDQHDRVA